MFPVCRSLILKTVLKLPAPILLSDSNLESNCLISKFSIFVFLLNYLKIQFVKIKPNEKCLLIKSKMSALFCVEMLQCG